MMDIFHSNHFYRGTDHTSILDCSLYAFWCGQRIKTNAKEFYTIHIRPYSTNSIWLSSPLIENKEFARGYFYLVYSVDIFHSISIKQFVFVIIILQVKFFTTFLLFYPHFYYFHNSQKHFIFLLLSCVCVSFMK